MFELKKFRRFDKAIREHYEPKIEACLNALDNEKAGKLQLEMHERLDTLMMEQETYECQELLQKCTRLDVPFPPFHDDECWQKTGDYILLTTKGRLTIRKAIDEERTRRREVSAWWWKTVIIPALAALTGIVGALTGLAAVLHKK